MYRGFYYSVLILLLVGFGFYLEGDNGFGILSLDLSWRYLSKVVFFGCLRLLLFFSCIWIRYFIVILVRLRNWVYSFMGIIRC